MKETMKGMVTDTENDEKKEAVEVKQQIKERKYRATYLK